MTASFPLPGLRLTQGQSKQLLSTLAASIDVESRDDFNQWVACHVRPLIPHEMSYCQVGTVNSSGIAVSESLGLNFPKAYLEEIKEENGNVGCPVMSKWLRERHAQIFKSDFMHGVALPEKWITAFRRHDLRNIAAHGVVDLNGETVSYFSFCRIRGNLGAAQSLLLEILVPHMHQALIRALSRGPSLSTENVQRAHTLTKREEQVLNWLIAGKTNWEIAAIVGSSENTVKNQVSSVLAKLGVSTRTQAATRALSLGLAPSAR